MQCDLTIDTMDGHADYDSYEDELFFWKSRAIQLETDINEISVQYEKMKALKEQLELHIMQSEQPIKPKPKRTQSKHQQELKIFLQQKKNDANFMASLKKKLTDLNFIKENEKVPWYVIRDECKRLFEQTQIVK